jgi:hypothetical protein
MYVKLQFKEYLQVKSYKKSKRVSAGDLIDFLSVRELNLKGMPLVCK